MTERPEPDEAPTPVPLLAILQENVRENATEVWVNRFRQWSTGVTF